MLEATSENVLRDRKGRPGTRKEANKEAPNL